MTTPDLDRLPRGAAGRWWVYSHINARGDTLYVGCTNAPQARNMKHRNEARWWPQVASVGLIGPWTVKQAAFDAERDLIKARCPEFNIAHTSRGLAAAYKRNRRTAAKRRADA